MPNARVMTIGMPRSSVSSTPMPEKMSAKTAFMPSQSVTDRSAGLPAIARRFWVLATNDWDVIFWTVPERRTASGRTVRSKNGCWSSSSSRFRACIDPSWRRRAWTGSIGELPARPITIRRIAPPATKATMIGRRGMALDLDVHDLADHHEADEHHEAAEDQDDDAGR